MKTGITTRLTLGYAAVITAVLLTAWISQKHLAEAEAEAEALSSRSIQAIELAARLETLMHEKSYVSNFLLSGDTRYLAQTQQHYQEFAHWIDGMRAFAHTDAERLLVDELKRGYLDYVNQGDEVIRLQQEGSHARALAAFFAMKREVDGLLGHAQRLFSLETLNMQESRAHTAAAVARHWQIMFALTGIGSVLSLIAGVLLSRHALRPIYRLVLRMGESGVLGSAEASHDELTALEAHVNALIERVRQQERSLARAAKLSEIGEIAAELAHEILNPVAGVKAMLQALRRIPVAGEELSKEHADMERDLGRVESIIRRLMRYARPLEPAMKTIRIIDLVNESVTTARKHPAAQDRSLQVAPFATDLDWVLDDELVCQVLVNLLVNACEASPAFAAVELSVFTHDEKLRILVRDHGVGVSDVTQGRLFRPFFTTKERGNGLGLAVSRNIVHEHGGSIAARNAPDRGAIFEVTLPQGVPPCPAPSLLSTTKS